MITGTALEQDVKRCAEALIDHAVITAEGDRALLEKIRRHAPPCRMPSPGSPAGSCRRAPSSRGW